jgi:hypothetical protein
MGLPTFFVLIFPTVVMVVLWCQVQNRQRNRQAQQQPQQQQPQQQQEVQHQDVQQVPQHNPHDKLAMESKAVARQAALYLLALYWSYLFTMINKGIQVVEDRMVFVTGLLSAVSINLQGVWFFLVYRHFTKSSKKRRTKQQPTRRRSSRLSCISNRTVKSSNPKDRNKQKCVTSFEESQSKSFRTKKVAVATAAKEFVDNGIDMPISAEEGHDNEEATNLDTFPDWSTQKTNLDASGDTTAPLQQLQESFESSNASSERTLNIFDGTNAGGSYAEYIYDGDSDDDVEDALESMHWSQIQEHI